MSESNKLVTQWRSVSHLLDEALLLPASERGRWLAELPPDQIHLRETLRHFLELHARIDGEAFLESPAQAPLDAITAAPLLSSGATVGPYRVIEEIGSGGMGSVWLAERSDGKPRRRIALKLPRMVWASDLSARLERERDILASLEHPNIARLYDAGLDEQGRPYLAIEYVEGSRITQYCQEHQLDPRRRIELFLQVLAAVQYAHTRLVIHRDLKPSNILVNRNGDVRLLDFGIAKLVEDSRTEGECDLVTATRALTPRYASPEQLRSERLTLVSDVYSLGVVLYELLVGQSPYPVAAKSRAALEIAVMDGAVTPPSRRVASIGGTGDLQLTGIRLSRTLRGDLDAIVLKALALDIHGRYASVEAFAADLRRWLDGQPVLASAPSKFTIVQKFVLRNRIAVSLATAATLMILTMTGVAVHQAQKATAESQRAAATRDFLIDMFEGANPELHGGREATVRELVSAAEIALYSSLDQQPIVQAEMLGSLVNVWLRLGDRERADRVLDKKIQALVSADEEAALVSSTIDKINLSLHIEKIDAAVRALEDLKKRKNISQLDPADQVTLLWQEGWIKLHEGNLTEALSRFLEVENLARRLSNSAGVVSALYGQSIAHKNKQDWRRAVSSLREARTAFSAQESNPDSELVGALELISAHLALGLYKEGLEFLNKTITSANSRSRTSAEISASQELALSLKLGGFRESPEEIVKKYFKVASEAPLEVRLLVVSILIESGDIGAAERQLASIQESVGQKDEGLDAQLNLRRFRIALINGDILKATLLMQDLEEYAQREEVNVEIMAKLRSSMATLRFMQSQDERASQYFLESADYYKKRYGGLHPKYLEAILAASLLAISKRSAENPMNARGLSPAVLLDVLRQAYPQDHPIVRLAEQFSVETDSSIKDGRSIMSRERLLSSLLLLS